MSTTDLPASITWRRTANPIKPGTASTTRSAAGHQTGDGGVRTQVGNLRAHARAAGKLFEGGRVCIDGGDGQVGVPGQVGDDGAADQSGFQHGNTLPEVSVIHGCFLCYNRNDGK